MASNVQPIRRFPPSQPAKVAAVCYRQRGGSVEFLLVNTESGRWTFPKGSVEAHLGPRDSAALEAIEEAGALGRISEEHFCVYLHAKGSCRRGAAAILHAMLRNANESDQVLLKSRERGEETRSDEFFASTAFRGLKMRFAKRRSSGLYRARVGDVRDAILLNYDIGPEPSS